MIYEASITWAPISQKTIPARVHRLMMWFVCHHITENGLFLKCIFLVAFCGLAQCLYVIWYFSVIGVHVLNLTRSDILAHGNGIEIARQQCSEEFRY
jgi:hypothetical protein